MTDLSQDTIANATFYTILVRWPREVRLFTHEGPMLESEAEVLAALDQLSGEVACIFRHDYDIPRKDVTEDIARAAYRKLIDAGHTPSDSFPVFIMEHAPSDCDCGYRGCDDGSMDDERASAGAWAA